MASKTGKITKISFITSNPHKVSEAQNILKEYGIKVVQKDINCDEIRADDVSEVAYASALQASKAFKNIFVVEDSGLFIKRLNGFPGVYSKNAFEKLGACGILRLMRGVSDRSAQFRCSIALNLGGRIRVINGICDGSIAHAEKGDGGFGFDPVFIPRGSRKTFSQDMKLKNKVSHRVQAFSALGKFIVKKSKVK